MDPLIQLEGVSTCYRPKSRRGWRRRSGRITALDDVTATVARGEVLGIIGANGAGKTTLLLTVAGIVPAEGVLFVARPICPLISHSSGFNRELSGRENLFITSLLLGASRKQARDRYDAMAEFTELDDSILNAPVFTYSAGMAMRLGFAAIVYNDPAVLLIDEVLSAVDEGFRAKCIEVARQRVAAGAAMILVSHDMALVSSVADRVGVLQGGRLAFLGSPADGVNLHHRSMARPAETSS